MAIDVSSDAAAVREIARLTRDGLTSAVSGGDAVGLPPLMIKPGGAVESLERLLPAPLRKRAAVKLRAVESFVGYVAAHREPGTMLFADFTEKGGRVVAVIDYHLPTPAEALALSPVALGGGVDVAELVAAPAMPAPATDAGALARWGDHRVVLALESSPEWARWTGNAGKDLPQVQFAEFLEENAPDVVVPAAAAKAPNSAQMLDVALTLQAKTEVAFSSGVRLSNGQAQLQYHEVINATAGADGKLEVPERFYLSLRPFVGVSAYLVEARLRYRISGGKLTFRYDLARLHRVIEDVCKDTVQQLSEGLKLPVLIGEAPERSA